MPTNLDKPSFEKIEYSLRPAKNIERKMICEAMARLSRLAQLSKYQYVGLGSIGFYDFSLFHQRLGINKMVSIERQDGKKDRFNNNRPYACIEMAWGESYIVLPTLDLRSSRNIVWLDYDKYISKQHLQDVSVVVASIKTGSAIIVTLAAEADNDDDGPASVSEQPTRRLNRLKGAVGENSLRPSVKAGDLKGWGFAKVCRNILADKIQKELNNRNAAASTKDQLQFVQLFNFGYRDGMRMMTFGGIFLNEFDARVLKRRHFSDLDFIRLGEEQFIIEPPVLTQREVRHLDTLLPGAVSSVTKPHWIPLRDRQRYKKVYRYFPRFSEVEA